MRISDWISDVCSSDLPVANIEAEHLHGGRRIAGGDSRPTRRHGLHAGTTGNRHVLPGNAFLLEVFLQHVERGRFAAGRPPVNNYDAFLGLGGSSEERRDGKAVVSKLRSRWWRS